VAILSGAHDNNVQGNFIGTNAAGTGPLANTESGVLIARAVGPGGPIAGSGPGSTNNTIGGPSAAAANRIAYNASYGVRVDGKPETGNAIYRNSIFGNHLTPPGIALSAGSDLTSSNVGNGNEPSPQITTQKTSLVSGTVVAPHQPRVEVFSNPSCADPEGKTFLGADATPTQVNATTWRWSVPIAGLALSAGQGVTATGTDKTTLNTSRFSACKQAVAG
jgi:hypothetical protein